MFSSQVQKVNMITEPDEYTLNTLTHASKRKGHRYSHSQQDDNDDDDDYSQRLVPEPQPHDSLSEPVFVRRSISMKQQGLFDSLDRSSSFVPSSSSSMRKSHVHTSLNESSYHNIQEGDKVKEGKSRWSAATTIQKHVRGHLGRRIAAKQQLLQERNRLKSRQRKQQLRQETEQHQHQQSRKQMNISFENRAIAETVRNGASSRSSNSNLLVTAPIDDDNTDMLEGSLMIRRSGGQFHAINQSISNNQKKQQITSKWLEMQVEEEDHDTVPVPETNESFDDNDDDDNDDERMHGLEDSLVDYRHGTNATDDKTVVTNIRCSTTTVTTTIPPPSTSCTATTATAMTAMSFVVPCGITSQRSMLPQPIHVVPTTAAAKSTIATQSHHHNQQQQQQELQHQQQEQQPQQQHKKKAEITSSTQPKQLPSSTPCLHFPPSVDDLLEATTIVTQSVETRSIGTHLVGTPSVVKPSVEARSAGPQTVGTRPVGAPRSSTPMSRTTRKEGGDNTNTTVSNNSRVVSSQQRNNYTMEIPTQPQQSHQSQSQRRQSQSPQTLLQPPQLPQPPQSQQQPLPPQPQTVSSGSASAQGTRARARSVSCTRGSQLSQSSQPQPQVSFL